MKDMDISSWEQMFESVPEMLTKVRNILCHALNE